MGKAIQNLALFKAGWIACLLLAALGRPTLAVIAVALVVGLHLVRHAAPAKEALLLASASAIGLVWESIVVSSGLIQYTGSASDAMIAPMWIVAMWALFATTINQGFRWMKRNWVLAAAMGLIGGPLAFIGGVGMGAAEFSNTPLALAVIGAGWMLLLPLLCLIADSIIDSPVLEPRARLASQRTSRSLLTALGRLERNV